jgi:hypothetical protein
MAAFIFSFPSCGAICLASPFHADFTIDIPKSGIGNYLLNTRQSSIYYFMFGNQNNQT